MEVINKATHSQPKQTGSSGQAKSLVLKLQLLLLFPSLSASRSLSKAFLEVAEKKQGEDRQRDFLKPKA